MVEWKFHDLYVSFKELKAQFLEEKCSANLGTLLFMTKFLSKSALLFDQDELEFYGAFQILALF